MNRSLNIGVPLAVAAVMVAYFAFQGSLDLTAIIGIVVFLCIAAVVPLIARALMGNDRGV